MQPALLRQQSTRQTMQPLWCYKKWVDVDMENWEKKSKSNPNLFFFSRVSKTLIIANAFNPNWLNAERNSTVSASNRISLGWHHDMMYSHIKSLTFFFQDDLCIVSQGYARDSNGMLNRNAYLKSEVSTISQDSKCPPRSHTSDIPEVARVVCTLHVQHRMSYGSKSTCCARLPRKKEAIMSCLIFLIFPFPFFLSFLSVSFLFLSILSFFVVI